MSRATMHLLRYILGAIIALAIGAAGIALDAASLDDVQAMQDSLQDAQRDARQTHAFFVQTGASQHLARAKGARQQDNETSIPRATHEARVLKGQP